MRFLALEAISCAHSLCRTRKQAEGILIAIAQFPTRNPSNQLHPDQPVIALDDAAVPLTPVEPSDGAAAADINQLLQAIRMKYRLLASAMGVRPRLPVAGSGSGISV